MQNGGRLLRQFARGCENGGKNTIRVHGQVLQNGQDKGGRFALARLGTGQDVRPRSVLQQVGNDRALDNISFRPCGPLGIVYNTEPDGIICEDQGFPELSADIGTDSLSVIQWQISPDQTHELVQAERLDAASQHLLRGQLGRLAHLMSVAHRDLGIRSDESQS